MVNEVKRNNRLYHKEEHSWIKVRFLELAKYIV